MMSNSRRSTETNEGSPLSPSSQSSRGVKIDVVANDEEELCACNGCDLPCPCLLPSLLAKLSCKHRLCCNYSCCTWTCVVVIFWFALWNFFKLPSYWPSVQYMTNVTYNAQYCQAIEPTTQECFGLEASPPMKWFDPSWRGQKISASPANFVAPHAAMGISLDVLLVAQLLDRRPPGVRFAVFNCLYFFFLLQIIPVSADGIPSRAFGFNFNGVVVGFGMASTVAGLAAWWMIDQPSSPVWLLDLWAKAPMASCRKADWRGAETTRRGWKLLWWSWIVSAVTLNSGPVLEWVGVLGTAAGVFEAEGDAPIATSGHDWYSTDWGGGAAGWTIVFLVLIPTALYIVFLFVRGKEHLGIKFLSVRDKGDWWLSWLVKVC